ncbi:MAG: GNAT family N-acetyltransferase [Phycisphaerae bacterium]|nr:GNAT family N-acetyltransferase [Phycisphaerae bacterium]
MEPLIPDIETLQTGRLVLRPLTMNDAESVVRICSNFEVVRNMLTAPHPYTLADAETFLRKVTAQGHDRDSYVWAITRRTPRGDAGEHIGTIGLHGNWTHHHAEVGYCLARHEWGNGFATESLRAAVHFAFTRTSLVRLHAGYYTRNPASGRVLQKCGFTHEGLRPRMYLRFGDWLDLALMRLLREEWNPAAPPASP